MPSSYRVKSACTVPSALSRGDRRAGYPFIGVSLRNPAFFSEDKFRSLVRWTARVIAAPTIVIFDSLERHNFWLDEARGSADAYEDALILWGQRIEAELQMQTDSLSSAICCWSSLKASQEREFQLALAQVQSAWDDSEILRRTIVEDVDDFFTRIGHRLRASFSCADARDHCVNYILEEIAACQVLSRRGLTISVYPGKQIRTVKLLASGSLDELGLLQNTVFIDVRIYRNKSRSAIPIAV